MKHNKKKNIGILFELLTRKVIESTLDNKPDLSKKASSLINKYFSHNNILNEELTLFNTLLYNQTESHRVAGKILETTLAHAKILNTDKVSKEKNNLLKEVKDVFDEGEFFKVKIPNYKTYASIQQLLDDSRKEKSIKKITDRIVLEENVLDHLINNTEKERVESNQKTYNRLPIDNLTNRLIQKKFNEKYDTEFNAEQKEVLKYYINNQDKEYKLTAEQELEKIDQILDEAIKNHDDPVLKVRLKDAKKVISESNLLDLSKDNLSNLMTYMDLARDLQEDLENAG